MTTQLKFKLDDKVESNKAYRKVIYTDDQQQIVLMNLHPGEDIPQEVHPHTTQFLHVVVGDAVVHLNNRRMYLTEGDAVMIPADTPHYVANRSDHDNLQLYTIYSPPEFPAGLKQRNQEEAANLQRERAPHRAVARSR